jgi:hypothetical protein
VIAGMVILSDVTLFHSRGYLGPAVFFPLAAILLLAGVGSFRITVPVLVTGLLLLLLAARLAWSGSVAQIVTALWLLNAYSMTLHGFTPFLLESVMFLASTIPGGYELLRSIQIRCRRVVLDPMDRGEPSRLMNVFMPLLSVLIFGTIFVMANPDLMTRMSSLLGDIIARVHSWLMRYSMGEIVFWCSVAWLTAGLLRPLALPILNSTTVADSDESIGVEDNSMFTAFRNTLVALIVLFAAYLVFEFMTLWFRRFPDGFHYSGYAHQGAAWLTAALALATVVLSLMFRGTMLRHSQLSQLQRLALGWSALNFLLAASVYNRLLIYIDFNGMTRMRVVGLLGISAVVGGFVLVLWKIARRHSFHWLIQHQLLLPAAAVYIFVALPIDTLVHQFNVRRILAGHPEPSVQISEHPIEDAALPVLIPLLECENEIIRNGIRSILASRLAQLQFQSEDTANPHWTAWQGGIEQARRRLNSVTPELLDTATAMKIDHARARFREYSMQWW